MAALSEPATLLFHPEKQLLEVIWLGPVSSAALRATYRRVLTYVARHPIRRLLFDVRQRNRADWEDEKWVSREFIPRLPKLLAGSGPRLACLLLPALYDALLPESPDGTMTTESELLSLAYFTDRHQALAWLEQPE
ncbi:hypothetical protein GCM10022408_10390 [Hymenobacter fastidiosus]|uniref:STAS/SEC14 domain-containing protein n=1 Tax=Hymenobacter fastidiosus TaxID=486264 RepID=A0ABP7RRK4_9BACT